MKNIHVLPTEKPSRLWKNNLLQGKLVLSKEVLLGSNTAQHIYITDDSEIKERDYAILGKYILSYHQMHKKWGMPQGKKIILTTDTELIADGVQAIDDWFLEWFVQNPTCEVVGVEKQYITPLGDVVDTCYDNERLNYKIILPQDEAKEEGYVCTQTKKQCDDECCVNAENCHIESSKGVLSEPTRDYKKLSEKFTETLNSIPDDALLEYAEAKQETLTYSEASKKEERIFNSTMMLKQKTLDEFIEKEVYEEGMFSPHIWSDGVKAGAKWQAERIETLLTKLIEDNMCSVAGDELIQQFKKQKQ